MYFLYCIEGTMRSFFSCTCCTLMHCAMIYSVLSSSRCQRGFVASGFFFSVGNKTKWLVACLRLPTPGLGKHESMSVRLNSFLHPTELSIHRRLRSGKLNVFNLIFNWKFHIYLSVLYENLLHKNVSGLCTPCHLCIFGWVSACRPYPPPSTRLGWQNWTLFDTLGKTYKKEKKVYF